MARLAFTVGGGLAGGLVGQPGLGAAAGGLLGSILFPPDDIVQQGSRVNNQATTASAYGLMRPWGYGQYMVSGNIIDGSDRRIIQHKDKTSAGGKGGGQKVVTEWETAERDLAVGLGVGPISGVLKVYANELLLWDATPGAKVRSPLWLDMQIYLGGEDQEPDPTLESIHGAGNVPAYRGEAYIMFRNFQLEIFGNSEPSFRFLIVKTGAAGTSQTIIQPGLGQSGGNMLYDRNRGLVHFLNAKSLAAGPDPQILGYVYEPSTQQQVAVYPWQEDISNLDEGCGAGLLSIPTFVSGVEVNLGANAHLIVNTEHSGTPYWDIYDSATGAHVGAVAPSVSIDTNTAVLVADETKGLVYLVNSTVGFTSLDLYSIIINLGVPSIVSDNEVAIPVANRTGSGEWTWRTEPSFPEGTDRAGTLAIRASDGVDSVEYLCIVDGRYAKDIVQLTEFGASSVTKILWDSVQLLWWCVGESSTSSTKTRIKAYDTNLVEVYSSELDYDVYLNQDYITYDNITRSIWLFDTSDTGYLIQYSTTSQQVINTYTGFNTTVSATLKDSNMLYHATSRTVWRKAGDDIILMQLDRLSSNTTYLSDVIADICSRAGMPASRYDTSACSAITVEGYPIDTGGSYRSKLLPLLSAYLVYGVDKEDYLDFLPYSTDIVAQIPERDLGASTGDQPRHLVEVMRMYEDELPYKVEITYYNALADYEQGAQSASRQANVNYEGKQSLVLPLVLTDDEAAALADVRLHMTHVARLKFRVTMMPKWRWLSGADLVRFTDDSGVNYIARILQKKFVNGILEIEAERFDPSVLTSFLAGGAAPGRDAIVEETPLMLAYYLDSPLFRERDDNAGFYLTATSYSSAFRGGSVYESESGTGGWSLVRSVFGRSRIGWVVERMPVPANKNLWDVNTSVTVQMLSGELESVPASTVVKGSSNLVLIGGHGRWEAAQFADKTLISAGKYSVTNWLRGRLGTEHAMDQHQAGDALVFVAEEDLTYISDTLARLNTERIYRAVAFGADLYGYQTLDTRFTNRGVCLEPYAPAGARVDKNPANLDLTIKWSERTRYPSPNAWTGVASETSTEFSMDVQDSNGSVVATYATVGASQRYSRVSQLADGFDTLADTGTFEIFQISETTGRGYAAVVEDYALGPTGRPAYEVFALSLNPKVYWPLNEADTSDNARVINAVTNTSTGEWTINAIAGESSARATGIISSLNPDLCARVSGQVNVATVNTLVLGNASIGTLATLFTQEASYAGKSDLMFVRNTFGTDTTEMTLSVNSAGVFRVWAASAGTSGLYATATTSIAVGQTYHLAGSVGASGIKAYVNGQLERTRTDGVKRFRGGQCRLYIGWLNGVTQGFPRCRIQGPSFYSYQMTDANVSILNQKRFANK